MAALGVTGSVDVVERDGQVRLAWDDTPVDLFFSYDRFHDAAAKGVRVVPFADTTIPILAAEHLVVCKVIFDRPKDWVDIDAMRADATALDAAEILRWVATHLRRYRPPLQPHRGGAHDLTSTRRPSATRRCRLWGPAGGPGVGGWVEVPDAAGVSGEGPAVVEHVVVTAADEGEIVEVRFAAAEVGDQMVGVGPAWGSGAVGDHAAAVAVA